MTGVLSLDNASRLWDVMVFEGDAVVIRAGVAWLVALEGRLFGEETKEGVYAVLRGGLGGVEEEAWIGEVRAAGRH